MPSTRPRRTAVSTACADAISRRRTAARSIRKVSHATTNATARREKVSAATCAECRGGGGHRHRPDAVYARTRVAAALPDAGSREREEVDDLSRSLAAAGFDLHLSREGASWVAA